LILKSFYNLFFLIGLGLFSLNLGSKFHDGLGVNLQICQHGFWSENELGEEAIADLASAIQAPTGEQTRGGN
jgi:hypothetical protein